MSKISIPLLLLFLFAAPAKSERIYQGYNANYSPTNPRIDFIQTETGDILSASMVTGQNRFQVAQFDPGLGTLERVFFSFHPGIRVFMSASTQPGVSGIPLPLTGNETESTILAQGTYRSSLTVDTGLPGLASQVFDDREYYAGCTTPLVYIGGFPDFGNYDPCTGFDSENDNRIHAFLDSGDPAVLSAFTGTGVFDIVQEVSLLLDSLTGDPGSGFFQIEYDPYDQGLFFYDYEPFSTGPAVPVPAGIWLFGTALIGFVGYSRRRKLG